MCTEQLPPGGYTIAVKYMSYYHHIIEEIVRQVGYLPEKTVVSHRRRKVGLPNFQGCLG